MQNYLEMTPVNLQAKQGRRSIVMMLHRHKDCAKEVHSFTRLVCGICTLGYDAEIAVVAFCL